MLSAEGPSPALGTAASVTVTCLNINVMCSELVSVISLYYDWSEIEIFCCFHSNKSASKPSEMSAGGGGPGRAWGEVTGEIGGGTAATNDKK